MTDDTSTGASEEMLRSSIEADTSDAEPALTASAGAEKGKNKKDKGPGSNRGVETMFRVSYDNNIQLIKLADNKANTLIGINGMIISVIIALVSPRIDIDTWLLAPSVVLLIGCLTTLTLAILASRPRLFHGEIDLESVRNNTANILFFGNFTQLKVEEFVQGMDHLMSNRRVLYDNMVRDLYSMGRVLNRKYHYLAYAYIAFMLTLGLSSTVFVTVFYLMAH